MEKVNHHVVDDVAARAGVVDGKDEPLKPSLPPVML
jgi:hypothetical protein